MSDESDEQQECPADGCDFQGSSVQSVSQHIKYCDYVSDDTHYPTEEMMLNELCRLSEKRSGTVSASEMDKFGKYNKVTYMRRFGSWNEALREAGLQINQEQHSNISKEALLDELRRLAEKFDGTISASKMDEFGEYSSHVYQLRFGSWNNAVKKVGLDVYEPPTGKDHPGWSGGTNVFSATLEGEAWRKAVFQRDQYTCQDCGESGRNLNAHHIKRRSEHPDLELQIWNGVTLCRACHAARHKGEECHSIIACDISDDDFEQREARLTERDRPYSEEVWDEVPFIRESNEPFRE